MIGWRNALAVSILAMGLAALPLPARSQTPGSLQEEQARFQAELLGIEKAEIAVLQDLFRLNRTHQELQVEIAALTRQLGELQQRLTALGADSRRLQAEYERRRLVFGKRLRFYYMEGTAGLLELVLAAQDFADFVDRLYLLELIVRADAGLMSTLRGTRRALAEQEALLSQQEQQLAAVTRQLTEREQDLQAAVQERELHLASLRARRGTVEAALGSLEQIWQDQVRPVLASFGQALHTLKLRGPELEPDAVQVQWAVPPRLRIVVSTAALNRFLQRDPVFASLTAAVKPGQVVLAGSFSGVPLEIAGRFVVKQDVIMQFQPDTMRFFGVELPASMARELGSTGLMDLNVADALSGGRLLEVEMAEGRITVLASLR